MNRTLFSIFISLFLQSTLFSQNDIDEIKEEAVKYFYCLKNHDYDKRLDYFHPKVFEVLSKKELKEEMKRVFEDSDVKIEPLDIDILSVSKIIVHEGKKYAMICDSTKSKMTFSHIREKSEKEKMDFLELIKYNIESQFKERKAKIDSKNTSLIVSKKNCFYAVYDVNFGWKFMDYGPAMKLVFDEIIPEDILTKLQSTIN